MPRACELYVLMLCVVVIATSMLALKGKELSIVGPFLLIWKMMFSLSI